MKKLVIERQTGLGDWDTYAYPRYDFNEAKNLLKELREEEKTKKYGKPLRLVHITREIIELDSKEIFDNLVKG